MADKSAFVPVDVSGGGKGVSDDVDMDDELFGKKGGAPAAPPPPKAAPPPPPPPPPAPASASPAKKFTYQKPKTYTKTYAGQK